MRKLFSKLTISFVIISSVCFSTPLVAGGLDDALTISKETSSTASTVDKAVSRISALKEHIDDIRKASEKVYDGVKNQSKFSKFLGNLGIAIKLGDIAVNAVQTIQADNKADFVKNFEESVSGSLATIIELAADVGATAAYAAAAGSSVTLLGGVGFLVLGVALDFGTSYGWNAIYTSYLKDEIIKLGEYIWNLLNNTQEGGKGIGPVRSSILSGTTEIKQSQIRNENYKVTNEADGKSKINSGISLRGSKVESSNITNINSNVNNKAINRSTINSGINADNSTIKKSTILNENSNNVNIAKNQSEINTGIKLKSSKVENSRVFNQTRNTNNTASDNSKTNAGIDLSEEDDD